MDNLNRYIETASDLNVEGVEFYIDGQNPLVAYENIELTKEANLEDLIHYFKTNDLVFVITNYGSQKEYIRPCSMFHQPEDDGMPEYYEFLYTSQIFGEDRSIIVEIPANEEVQEENNEDEN